MNDNPLETYLTDLARELKRHGLNDSGFLNEAREHLIDGIEAGKSLGLTADAAALDALDRFGQPKIVAAGFVAEKYRILHRVLFVVAVLLGLAIAYVDSRPTWDDTGITAFSMLLGAGVLGVAGPQRPWLWALAMGIWIPLLQVAHAPTLGSVAGGLLILAFPTAGAYAGMFCRRTLALH